MSDSPSLAPDLRPVDRQAPAPLEPVGEPSALERWGGGCLSTLSTWILVTAVVIGALEWDGGWAVWAALGIAIVLVRLMRWFEGPATRGRRRIRRWRRAARKLGWKDVRHKGHGRLMAAPDGLRLALTADDTAQARLVLTPAWPDGAPPPALTVARDLLGTPPSGDPHFDGRVGVQGEPSQWRGLWDPSLRHLVADEALAHGLHVADGAVQVDLVHVPKQGRRQRRALLEQWASVARSLVPASTPAAALLRRVEAEPDRVGLLAFESLRALGDPAVAQSARAEARLRKVAEAGGPLGVSLGALLGDAALMERGLPHHPPWAQRWALEHLVSLWPEGEVDDRLRALLDHRAPPVRGAALQVMGARHTPLPLARLVTLASGPGPVVDGLLGYLDQTPLADAEPLWIALLTAEHPAALRAAVDALANIGTRAAVAPLLAVDGGWRFQRHVERALEAIRARLPAGAAAGHLAVVEGDAGGLALAAEAGEDAG